MPLTKKKYPPSMKNFPKEVPSTAVGPHRTVVPYNGVWAIQIEGNEKFEKTFNTKKEAVTVARKEAKEANAALTIQLKTGKVEKRISYKPNDKG